MPRGQSRFPRSNSKITSQKMRRFLEQEDIPVEKYCEWHGSPILADFFRMNPLYTLRDWAKLVAENREAIIG